MFGKTFKIIIGILFIPVVIASTRAFFLSLKDLSLLGFNLALLTAGFFTYPIFHIVFFRPMYLYSVGHEIVHVLATWLCGGKVTSFHISSSGGSVTTTKTNLFIRLSPYFVPIHAICLLLIYRILSGIFSITKFANELIFLVGFTMSFHIFMTIEVMKMRQPDIIKTGYFFSILLIYVANITIAILFLSLIFSNISFLYFAKKTFVLSKDMYISIFSKIFI